MFINPTVVLARMGNVSGILVGCSTRGHMFVQRAAADLLGAKCTMKGAKKKKKGMMV